MRTVISFISIFTLFSSAVVPGFVDELSVRLKTYYKGRQEQQLYLTFHQPKYIAGDTAFFKGYLFNRADYKLIPGKHIVNVHLIDNNNSILLSERILFEDGVGKGYMALNRQMDQGYHTLAAYTDEMLANSDTLSFLKKPFYIAGREQLILENSTKAQINVEGGRLIEGVVNRLVLRTSPSAVIKISHDLNANDTSFISDVSGWTRFNLTPKPDADYSVTVDSKEIQLPRSETTGVSIALDRDSQQEYYSVSIRASEKSPSLKALVHAIVTCGERIVFSRSFELSEMNSFTIPFQLTARGLNRLTVFTNGGNVLAERLFFVAAEKVTTTTELSSEILNTRNAVQLALQMKSLRGQPVTGRVSISITKDEYFLPDSGRIPSDLYKQLVSQNLLNDKSAPLTDWEQSERGFDDYLILHYRETIPWKELESATLRPYKKISPYYLKGRAVFTESSQPLPDSSFITFYLNEHESIFGRHTKDGYFTFPMYMNFGDDELFFRAEFKGKALEGVQIIPDNTGRFGVSSLQMPTTRTKKTDAYFKFATLRQTAEKSFNFYGSERNSNSLNTEKELQGDWKADFYVDIRKLKTFSSIAEMFHEVVPMVQVKRRNEENSVRVFLKPQAIYSRDNPLYIIDGMMTDNTDYFLSLSPEKIAMVKVIRSNDNLLHFGTLGKNGIIIIQSKTQEYRENGSTSDHSIQVKGLQQPIPFSFPEHAKQSRAKSYHSTPDLRPVLYWNPDVRIKDGKADLKFTTSDLTGKFTIKIEGLTESGDFVGVSKSFDVSFSRPD